MLFLIGTKFTGRLFLLPQNKSLNPAPQYSIKKMIMRIFLAIHCHKNDFTKAVLYIFIYIYTKTYIFIFIT